MTTLLISIDRTSLGLPPLVLSGTDDANPIGVTGYVEPAMQPRIRYAPDSDWVDGSVAVSAVWQQTVLGFDVCTTDAASEAAMRMLLAELRQALGQFRYTVTVTQGDAPAETWTCDMGTIGGAERTYINMRDSDPVWPVSIPCRPTRAIGA